jgi:soluble lytic murein transglycosylase-like protein
MISILASVIIIALISIGINVSYYKDEERLKVEIKRLKEDSRACALRGHRIDCMAKTLITVYGLSKWEAHYYSIIFDDFSKEFETPWEIYPAIIRIESNFKCTLVSQKSAKGIMQILETTAEPLAKTLEINYIKGETLWNDLSNIILGCYYLSSNIKNKGLDGGVQAYLGGPAYLVSAKGNTEVFKYLGEYKTTVGKEYKNLLYIYRGIVAESGYNYAEMHSSKYQDSIVINTELFPKGK